MSSIPLVEKLEQCLSVAISSTKDPSAVMAAGQIKSKRNQHMDLSEVGHVHTIAGFSESSIGGRTLITATSHHVGFAWALSIL